MFSVFSVMFERGLAGFMKGMQKQVCLCRLGKVLHSLEKTAKTQ